MAGLGWIHFSNTTRQKVLKVIDFLGEKGAIDELGIGVEHLNMDLIVNEDLLGMTAESKSEYL